VCGVNSASYYPSLSTAFECDLAIPPTCEFIVTLSINNLWARVDSGSARDFLLPHLLDTRTVFEGTSFPEITTKEVRHFHGTCGFDGIPGFPSDLDTDGDAIPDACDPCPYVSDANYVLSNVVTTLPDGDKDNVPDICDSCPSAPGKPNPYVPTESVLGTFLAQPDADGDGVGDVCDTCPNSDVRGVDDLLCCNSDADCQGPDPIGVHPLNRCVPVAASVPPFPPPNPIAVSPCPGFAGRCAMGRDLDRDFTADNCDNCPGAYAAQTDTDDDGVGDVCDNCPGKGTSPVGVDRSADRNDIGIMTCTSDAFCQAVSNNTGGVCVPGKIEPGPSGELVLKPNHCSKYPDPDGDDLGTQCDNCAFTTNNTGYGAELNDLNQQANCNLANEIAIGEPYPFTGDACDPNPCNRANQGPVVVNPAPQDVQGDYWATFTYNPQILPNSATAEFPSTQGPFPRQYAGTPVANVGARYCPCAEAQEHDALKCADTAGCAIDASDYGDPTSNWSPARIVATPLFSNGTPNTNALLPAPPLTSFPSELTNVPLAAPPKTDSEPTDNLGAYGSAHSWVSWDVSLNGATNVGLVPGTEEPVIGFGVVGVLWTAVRGVPQVAPLSVQAFRPYSNRYEPSFYGGVDPTGIGNGKSSCPFCDSFECIVCGLVVDMKDLIVQPETGLVFAQSLQGSVDITASIVPQARTALFDTTARFVTVAERGGWLNRQSLGFATLSSDGSSVRSVVGARNGLLAPVTRRGGGGVDTGASVAMTAAVDPGRYPPSRSDFGAVLSDNEQSLFVFGGTLASGELASDLWLFDIASSEWRQVAFGGPAPRKVLAATYVPETRSLWMVDAGTTAFTLARLLRYDVAKQRFHVAGLWPRTPIRDRVELSAAPDGDLLLTGSSSWLKQVTGVVLHPVAPSGSLVAVVGAFKRHGKLAIEPTLSQSQLTLPLDSNAPTSVEHVVIPAEDILFKPKKKGKGPKPPLLSIAQCL
jgi:hypothetical protein